MGFFFIADLILISIGLGAEIAVAALIPAAVTNSTMEADLLLYTVLYTGANYYPRITLVIVVLRFFLRVCVTDPPSRVDRLQRRFV